MNCCVSGFVKAVLKGCKRLDIAKARVPKQKSPILPEHRRALVSRFVGPPASLSDIRDVALCLLGFAGFLRFTKFATSNGVTSRFTSLICQFSSPTAR